jgi:hypothetical protein
MAAYDEFRLVVQPAMTPGGGWTVRIDASPIAAQEGNSVTLQPTMLRAQLDELRQAGFNDLVKLQGIGKAVWSSVLSNALGPSLEASAQLAAAHGRRLRVVLVRLGVDSDPSPGKVAVSELPFEALFHPTLHQFFAVDDNTPISRGLQVRPDRAAEAVPPPLRVLLIGANPIDKAAAQAVAEIEEIRKALQLLGDVAVSVSPSGSYDDFRAAMVAARPHVVHFAGHGGYSIVGDDPNPRPHLCFVRPDNGKTFEVDADTLAVEIKNLGVRLVVMTACASAAPAPPGMPYYCRALEGIAQRLVLGPSGVSAAIAMQFDIESDAAVTFSETFYKHLLKPEVCLDEAVTAARKEISQKKSLGHRAWVNPTVFWRCVDGRVFELDTALNPASITELRGWDATLEANLKFLSNFASDAMFGPVQAQKVMTEIRNVEMKRSELYRQGARLSPETAAAGAVVRVPVLLRISSTGTVDQLAFRLVMPAGMSFAGAQTPAGAPLPVAQPAPSITDVVIVQPSAGASWTPGEREVASITVAVDAAQVAGLLFPTVENILMRKNGADVPVRGLNPLFFVHRT